ncbi:AAA family ATPase [Bradyrhizobium sp. AZCC 1699]|uniref:ABC transporter ATP-binding protein C-terminal domain-containing protein n=1 Tax=unclassified Bradyrhizobium TaxID=2631580 RepID=UPI003FA5C2D7
MARRSERREAPVSRSRSRSGASRTAKPAETPPCNMFRAKTASMSATSSSKVASMPPCRAARRCPTPSDRNRENTASSENRSLSAIRAGSLSYGEQRLVGVALALAAEPSMLLLDEPVSGMNASETDTFVQLVRSIRDHGATILLVEHDMPMVMSVSDRIVVLNYGRIIAEGPPDVIRNDPAVIEAYLGQGATRA